MLAAVLLAAAAVAVSATDDVAASRAAARQARFRSKQAPTVPLVDQDQSRNAIANDQTRHGIGKSFPPPMADGKPAPGFLHVPGEDGRRRVALHFQWPQRARARR